MFCSQVCSTHRSGPRTDARRTGTATGSSDGHRPATGALRRGTRPAAPGERTLGLHRRKTYARGSGWFRAAGVPVSGAFSRTVFEATGLLGDGGPSGSGAFSTKRREAD